MLWFKVYKNTFITSNLNPLLLHTSLWWCIKSLNHFPSSASVMDLAEKAWDCLKYRDRCQVRIIGFALPNNTNRPGTNPSTPCSEVQTTHSFSMQVLYIYVNSINRTVIHHTVNLCAVTVTDNLIFLIKRSVLMNFNTITLVMKQFTSVSIYHQWPGPAERNGCTVRVRFLSLYSYMYHLYWCCLIVDLDTDIKAERD